MVKRLSLGKWIDGSMRLRISAPGFDVDSPSLTKDQLVFDSTLSGYGPVFSSGTFTIDGRSYSNQQVAAWPTLPSIPVIRMYLHGNEFVAGRGYRLYQGLNNLNFRIRTTPSGLFANGSLSDSSASLTFAYIVTAQL